MKDIYIVENGDTIESIAQHFMIRESDIISYNRIARDKILPGVILVIDKQTGTRHIVRPLENIEKIAKQHNISPEKLRLHNDVREVFLGQIIYIPD